MFVTINGASLFHETLGKGPPMILTHGSGEDHTIFDKLAERLKRGHALCPLDP
jgi:pimeloyl-ACP methyl ester carboxylesterase